jgi:hypothetical protein
MPATLFTECHYSVFFSYAFRDNTVPLPNWIGDFHTELLNALPDQIDGVKVPPIYFSEETPPVHGLLDETLRDAVRQSFAVMIFVADTYLTSEWCLEELKHFRAQFGDDGFRDRFFIVAMSKPAIDELKARAAWRAVCGDRDLVHLPFHRRPRDVWHRPMVMFVADPDRPGRKIFPATDFWELFLTLREALEGQMKSAVLREAPAVGYPTTVTKASADDLVRVYIEAAKQQEAYWESLQRQIVTKWDEVVAQEDVEPPLRLRPERLNAIDLHQSSALQSANGVILIWAGKNAASVSAQINAIEPHLPGSPGAPGIVAYLSTGPEDKPVMDAIQNWDVVRFRARAADGSTTVLAADAPRLSRFMHDVLQHKRSGA